MKRPKKGDIVRVENSITNYTYEGTVSWIVGAELAIQHNDNKSAYSTEKLIDKDCTITILQESAVDFQSQVASMTDDELKASIESLRLGRVAIQKKSKKEPTQIKLSEEEKQLTNLLSTLSVDETLELKKKLGIL